MPDPDLRFFHPTYLLQRALRSDAPYTDDLSNKSAYETVYTFPEDRREPALQAYRELLQNQHKTPFQWRLIVETICRERL